jgi:hypothetical protein
VANRLTIPGFVNAHSHAFERALRGRTEGGDFWAWRDAMLELADRQTSERVRIDYEQVYGEMRGAGYTAVGEFHYLGFEQALAAAEAAEAAGITFVLLYVAYARGGLERFRQASPAEYLNQVENLRKHGIEVGLAPHSVRACPPRWLAQIGRYAAEHELPLHVHADEQPREIEECIEEQGIRPIELLAKNGCLGPRRRSSTRRTPTTRAVSAQNGSRIALPTGRTSATDTSCRAGSRARHHLHQLRTRTRGSTPRDSEARWDCRRSAPGRHPPERCFGWAPRGSHRSTSKPGRRGRPRASVARGLDESVARAALVFGCAADVFV